MQRNSTKVIGKTISQLITLAQQLKKDNFPPVSDPPTASYMARQTPSPLSSVESYAKLHKDLHKLEQDRDRWRSIARKLQQDIKEDRRLTLSNFSLQEIEKELVRRLDIRQK